MITIQLANGTLDVDSSQAMELEVTAMRFSDGISDAYTNDLELPKTRNNIHLLECYNLLDSPNQLYGSQIKPAVLTVDGYMLDVHLQVVSVTDDAITVCLYGQTLPNDLRDKEVRELIRDDVDSIKAWFGECQTYWPDLYRQYDYGYTYLPAFAQLHQTKGAGWVMQRISSASGHTLPSTDGSLALMAQNRYVCPENTRQTISVQRPNGSGAELCIVAGQHAVNDAEGYERGQYEASEVKKITFNRDCTATVTPYISWGRKLASGTHTFLVSAVVNGHQDGGYTFTINGWSKRNGFLFPAAHTWQFHEGDTLGFILECTDTPGLNLDKLDHFQMIWDVEYSGYEIGDDDYGEEMRYAPELPTLYGWCPNYPDSKFEYKLNGLGVQEMYIYNMDGSLDVGGSVYKAFPLASWAYMGYWCNLSDITVGELVWGLAWLSGHGVQRTQTGLEWSDADRSKAIEGRITSISPTTDRLGQMNYITWAGGGNSLPVSEIDSESLEYEHTLAELPFAYMADGTGGLAKVPQYGFKPNDDGTYDVSYSEIDGQVLVMYRDEEHEYLYPALVPPPTPPDMGFSRMTSATEVEIETFDTQVTDLDYVYLDGRKYMIVSVSADLETNFSRITALLVPTT